MNIKEKLISVISKEEKDEVAKNSILKLIKSRPNKEFAPLLSLNLRDKDFEEMAKFFFYIHNKGMLESIFKNSIK